MGTTGGFAAHGNGGTVRQFMLKSERRRVTTQGIDVSGRLFFDAQLGLLVGQWVFVWYDPNDLTHIVVRPETDPSVRLVVADRLFDAAEADEKLKGA